MAGITLAQAETALAELLAAHTAITTQNQSYSINGRTLTRANLVDIREDIKYWDGEVKRLSNSNGSMKSYNAVPQG